MSFSPKFQNPHIHRKYWVSVPSFKIHIFIGNLGVQSQISKLKYSSETLDFSPMFQKSYIHRKYWISAPCFKTHIFIGNLGYQSQVSKSKHSSNTLDFSPLFQNPHIHRKNWVSVPSSKTHIFIGDTGFQSHVSKVTYSSKILGFSPVFQTYVFIGNTGFQTHVSKLTYSSEALGFSPMFYMFQNSLIHRKHWVCLNFQNSSEICFSPIFFFGFHIFIENIGFQSKVLKLTYSSETVRFSPMFQNSSETLGFCSIFFLFLFQSPLIHRKHWVSVPKYKIHIFIGNIGFQSQNTKSTYSSYSSETLGFSPKIQNQHIHHIHRKHWVSVPSFKTDIFIGNTGFQSQVSKLAYSSETLGFNPVFQKPFIHRKHWVCVPILKTDIFIGNSGFQSHVSKLVGNIRF